MYSCHCSCPGGYPVVDNGVVTAWSFSLHLHCHVSAPTPYVAQIPLPSASSSCGIFNLCNVPCLLLQLSKIDRKSEAQKELEKVRKEKQALVSGTESPSWRDRDIAVFNFVLYAMWRVQLAKCM